MPRNPSLSTALLTFVTGYTLHREFFSSRCISTPVCDCGAEEQDLQHLLYECPLTLDDSNTLQKELREQLRTEDNNLEQADIYELINRKNLEKGTDEISKAVFKFLWNTEKYRQPAPAE